MLADPVAGQSDGLPGWPARPARANGPVSDDTHRIHAEQLVAGAEPDGEHLDVVGHG